MRSILPLRWRPSPSCEAALQLGRRAVGAERDLEPPRHEPSGDARLVADEALEVAPEALVELGLLEIAELEPHAAAQRVVEAAAQEANRLRRGSPA